MIIPDYICWVSWLFQIEGASEAQWPYTTVIANPRVPYQTQIGVWARYTAICLIADCTVFKNAECRIILFILKSDFEYIKERCNKWYIPNFDNLRKSLQKELRKPAFCWFAPTSYMCYILTYDCPHSWENNTFWRPGVGVTKPISSVPLFSEFFSVIKTHVTYWISRLYLIGVAAAQLRWHMSNINVIRII